MPRPSNKARSEERNLCRKTLIEHIWKRTGVKVAKVHLRLTPKRQDKYYWKVLDPSNEELLKLFQTGPNQVPLSGLPKSVHEELQSYVGKTFEAVANRSGFGILEETEAFVFQDDGTTPPERNWSARIALLEDQVKAADTENKGLRESLRIVKDERSSMEEIIRQEQIFRAKERDLFLKALEDSKSKAEELENLASRLLMGISDIHGSINNI